MPSRYEKPYLYINGQRLSGEGRKCEPVLDPATGLALADVPHATTADLDAALAAASKAFIQWRATDPLSRSRILRGAASLIRERVEAIAVQMTLEQGKPLRESRLELLGSADVFDWYAEEGRRTYGRIVPGRTPTQRLTVRQEPLGVVASFSPWNFPALTPARKIAGALAAGCTLVLKASEETPNTALALAAALHDAGLPAGALNVVFGVPAEVANHLIAAPVVRKVSLTGSTAVGKLIAVQAAAGLKHMTLELGGHGPVIVAADAEVSKAVEMLAAFKYRNAGQVCISPTRFYVHEAVFPAFRDAFVEKAKALRLGNGLDDATGMGPMANPRRIAAMERLIPDSVKSGAKLLAGGERFGNSGFFFQPTVLSEIPEEATIMNEEPFGPVALINPIRSIDEGIERANRLPYGLAAYAFTQDARIRRQLADGVQSGMLAINSVMVSLPEAPFGGVKDSGIGSEGGIEGLSAYLETRLVSED